MQFSFTSEMFISVLAHSNAFMKKLIVAEMPLRHASTKEKKMTVIVISFQLLFYTAFAGKLENNHSVDTITRSTLH